jgi:hypothetical protein
MMDGLRGGKIKYDSLAHGCVLTVGWEGILGWPQC